MGVIVLTHGCSQYKTRLSKQEARSFHRPALQFPSNIELHFSKVRTAKKKKDKAGRKLGKGGNIGEGLRKTGDLSLRDTSNFVLWEYSVRGRKIANHLEVNRETRKNIRLLSRTSAWVAHWSTTTVRRTRKMTMCQRYGGNPRGWSFHCLIASSLTSGCLLFWNHKTNHLS